MRILPLLLLCLTIGLNSQAQELSQQAHKKEIEQHRKAYKAKLLQDQRSPFYGKPEVLNKLQFYPSAPRYRVTCSFEATPDAEPFDMATYSGKTRPYIQYGQLQCPLDNGIVLYLAVYRNLMQIRMPHYRDRLFLPFRDATNYEATYGGGRYLDLSTSDIKNQQITIDFNKSYNPWCAFSDGYNCPIPPRANHLEIAIPAGEKVFAPKVVEMGDGGR
ncbi:MAG: DUF1684 domain-containing protein [Bacteroidota bacterium]